MDKDGHVACRIDYIFVSFVGNRREQSLALRFKQQAFMCDSRTRVYSPLYLIVMSSLREWTSRV